MFVKKVLIVIGTRPEAIKLAPVIKAMKEESTIDTIVCSTGQHKEMLQQVLDIFSIKCDVELNLMTQNQTLTDLSANALHKISAVLKEMKPDLLLVQGDTTTAFIASLAAYYLKIDIGHVEAGLRSYNIYSPYPEEANRRFISTIAKYHFAPTDASRRNLESEGISRNIFITGNTVIDALELVRIQLSEREINLKENLTQINPNLFSKDFILITLHRREKFGEEFLRLLSTLKDLAAENPDLNFIYPVHLNPEVSTPVKKVLSGLSNFFLIPPQDYLKFLYLMSKCRFIMTDSGGVQEECFVFSKPVMILRDVTERMEAVEAGYGYLVGSTDSDIKSTFSEINERINKSYDYFTSENPFGDGKAAGRILSALLSEK